MKQRSKLKIGLLVLMLAVTIPSVTHAHFFFWWWLKPPAPPIEDVTFDPVDANYSSLYRITVENNQVQGIVKEALTQDTNVPVQAIVSNSGTELTFDPIILTNANFLVTINLDPNTPLKQGYFGSSFHVDGTATVHDIANDTDVDVPVHTYGTIFTKGGNYNLAASVRGFGSTDLGGGITEFDIFRSLLTSTTPVP